MNLGTLGLSRVGSFSAPNYSGYVSGGFGGGYSGGYGGGYVSPYSINQTSGTITAAYETNLRTLNYYIESGEVDKAMAEYDALVNALQESNGFGNMKMDENMCSSIIDKAYRNLTGKSFVTSVQEEASSPFWQGIKQSLPIVGLFAENTNEAEAMAEISNREVSLKDKLKEKTGLVLGTAAGIAGGILLSGSGVGAFVGVPLAIASAVSGIKGLFS